MFNTVKLFLFLLIASTYCNGQSNDRYLESLWSTIDFATVGEEPKHSDTMLVLCTIRTFDPSSRVVFGHIADSTGAMRYLLASRVQGRWKLYTMPSLKAAASHLDPKNDWVFYIEGMGKTFTANLYRATGLSLQYQVNVVVLDYPSVYPSHSLIRNFKTAKRNATNAYPSYTLFLKEIQDSKQAGEKWIAGKRTTLFQHSMGSRMLKEAIVQNALSDIQRGLVNRLVLNAPCVNQKGHARWISKINFADQILVHYNRQDLQLRGASVMTFRSQLGAKIRKPYAEKIRYVDFNAIAGKQHSIFLNRPGGPYIPSAAQAYYTMIFHEAGIDWQNPSLFYFGRRKPGVTLKP